jgi:hypothetical protein
MTASANRVPTALDQSVQQAMMVLQDTEWALARLSCLHPSPELHGPHQIRRARRLDGLDERQYLLIIGMTKRPAAVFVLERIHRVMSTAAHTHGKGHATAAFIVPERIVTKPLLGLQQNLWVISGSGS